LAAASTQIVAAAAPRGSLDNDIIFLRVIENDLDFSMVH